MADMIEVTLSTEDLASVHNEGSILVVSGTDSKTGERVTFAGDTRMMDAMLSGVVATGEAVCLVEGWQILGRQ